MAQDTYDPRQDEFQFMKELKAQGDVEKLEALYKVRTYDCSAERHQVLPNGTCMLCKRQVEHVR